MVVFNYLVPALFLNLTVQNTFQIGSGNLPEGGTLILGHIYNGTISSEPGFETSITGVINYGDDWPTLDTDKMHDRPNLRALITTDDGENLELTATGIQTPNAELGAIITGTGKGALAFGSFQSVFYVQFRTGAAKYKNLENSLFVASETVTALEGGSQGDFRAGLRVSKLYSTPTNITMQ